MTNDDTFRFARGEGSLLIRCNALNTRMLDGSIASLSSFFGPLQYSMSLDTYFKAALIK